MRITALKPLPAHGLLAAALGVQAERRAGCHGVLRKGATGKALTPEFSLAKGTEYQKVFFVYGSPVPMPPNGMDKISDAEQEAALEWVHAL